MSAAGSASNSSVRPMPAPLLRRARAAEDVGIVLADDERQRRALGDGDDPRAHLLDVGRAEILRDRGGELFGRALLVGLEHDHRLIEPGRRVGLLGRLEAGRLDDPVGDVGGEATNARDLDPVLLELGRVEYCNLDLLLILLAALAALAAALAAVVIAADEAEAAGEHPGGDDAGRDHGEEVARIDGQASIDLGEDGIGAVADPPPAA